MIDVYCAMIRTGVIQVPVILVLRPFEAALEAVAVPLVLRRCRAPASVGRVSGKFCPKPPSCSSASVRTSLVVNATVLRDVSVTTEKSEIAAS